MNSDIYITTKNQNTQKTLIVESDEHSVWTYLLNEKDNIEFDGFLCSRGTLVKTNSEIGEYIKNGLQPPLLEKLSNKFSIQKGLKQEDITIEWKINTIEIFIKNQHYLTMDLITKKAFSLSINENSPFGYKLNSK